MLEFGVPPAGAARALWELYVRLVLPLAGRLLSPGWHEVGRFLGPSIRDFEARLPLERQFELWSDGRACGSAGATAQPRRRRGDLGQTRMSVERRPAFYALARGGWRDYVTLLHLPYTLWHLSYVAIGAALAPELEADRLLWGLAAFALALGVGAHALDELHGRPLHTAIPRLVLDLAGGGIPRCGRRYRHRRRARVDALVAPVRRRRSVPRPRVCPRADGRRVPHGSLVRARLGGVPGAGGVSGRGGDAAARGVSRGGVRAAHEPGAALALDPGADGAAPSRTRERDGPLPRRARGRARRGRSDAGAGGRAARPLGRRWSRSRWRSSGCSLLERGAARSIASCDRRPRTSQRTRACPACRWPASRSMLRRPARSRPRSRRTE